jgi:pimeloyl-ACP methyl ester carboxylesterase
MTTTNTVPIYKSAAGEQAVMALYDQMLERWPVPYTSITLPTRHGDTFVLASGPNGAPPVILLHGAASNALAWIGDVQAYSSMLRVYAVDLPGEPGRSSHTRPPWSGPAYVEWMEDVLDGLGLERAALVGISQGAWTALKFATVQPERVDRLVLLAPAGVTTARVSFLLRVIPLAMMGKRGGAAINRITFGKQPIHPDVVAYMNVIMRHFKPRIGALPNFTDDELAQLIMPTLLMVGAEDALYPSEKTAARLQKLVPNLTVRMLPEMGHVLHGLVGEVVSFLAAEYGVAQV